MKRDMDVVRGLLLKIAAADGPVCFDDLVSGQNEQEREVSLYHMQMLVEEVGYVRGIDATTVSEGRNWIELQLTWGGHDFLDSVRDPTVWERTKEGAKKLGGVSLDVFVDLAKAYLRAEAKSRLGIDL